MFPDILARSTNSTIWLVLWASYGSRRHLNTVRLNCGRAYLHGCTFVQRNLGSWQQPVHVLTCPNKRSSQSRVLFSLQQHTTLGYNAKKLFYNFVSYIRFIRAVLPVSLCCNVPGFSLNCRISQSEQSFQLERVQVQGLLEQVDRLRVLLAEVVVKSWKTTQWGLELRTP